MAMFSLAFDLVVLLLSLCRMVALFVLPCVCCFCFAFVSVSTFAAKFVGLFADPEFAEPPPCHNLVCLLWLCLLVGLLRLTVLFCFFSVLSGHLVSFAFV